MQKSLIQNDNNSPGVSMIQKRPDVAQANDYQYQQDSPGDETGMRQ